MSLFRNLLLRNNLEKSPSKRWCYRIQVGHSDTSYPIQPTGSRIIVTVGQPSGYSTTYSLGSVDHTGFIAGSTLTEAYTYVGPERVWDSLRFYLEWNKVFDSLPDYTISVMDPEGTLLFSFEDTLNGKTHLSCSTSVRDLRDYAGQTVTLQLDPVFREGE